MILSGRGRYSKYIRPISVLFDVLALTVLFQCFFWELGLNKLHFGMYQLGAWAVISYFFGFYEVYRFTKPLEILSKIIRQGTIFTLAVIAFFPFSKENVFSGQAIAKYLITVFILITVFKFLLFYYLRRYRIITGSNYRKAIIIGYTPDSISLKQLFEEKTHYGYQFMGFFSDRKQNEHITGKISAVKFFAEENNIDDIYCSLNEVTNAQLKSLVEFADITNKTLKFIPDAKEIFTKNLKIDYYEFFPVLSLRKTPLHEPIAKFFKRAFDIAFSLFVIIFILSSLAISPL